MRTLIAVSAAFILAGCVHDEWGGSNYLARKDTITTSAGNAKEVNANQHIIDPWPPYAADRRIPGNGARMQKAIECYEGTAAASGGASNSGAGTQINIGGSGGSAAPAGCGRPPIRPVLEIAK
jgi:hypothetical protein